jgi:spore coat protein U-like protein
MSGVRRLVSLFILGATLVMGGRSASAQTCIITTTPVAFGNYDVFSISDLASTGSINYRCTWLVHQRTVYLSKGSAPSNNPRQMVSGANRLNYNLYLDAGHTQIWGDPNPYCFRDRGRDFTPNTTLIIYGSIPAGQDVPTGTYTDAIIATLNF